MNVGIIFATGLGNAVTHVPAIIKLKEQGASVTGIFTSPFGCEEMFAEFGILDDSISIKGKLARAANILTGNKFDLIICDRFACSRSHILFAKSKARQVVVQTDDVSGNNIVQRSPGPKRHISLMNQALAGVEEEFVTLDQSNTTDDYIVFQPGAGNNETPWKTWPLRNWFDVLGRLDKKIVAIGDRNESELIDQLKASDIPFDIKVGKTSIGELVELIRKSSLFIGHDSGPMHIAAIYNVPTFTIWGGSDPDLYGYAQFNPKKHIILYSKPECGPCDSWYDPNRNRVKKPQDCPDYKCIKQVTVKSVIKSLTKII